MFCKKCGENVEKEKEYCTGCEETIQIMDDLIIEEKDIGKNEEEGLKTYNHNYTFIQNNLNDKELKKLKKWEKRYKNNIEKIEMRYKFYSRFLLVYYVLVAGFLLQKYIFKNNLLFDALAFLACYNSFCYGSFIITSNKLAARILGVIFSILAWLFIMYTWTTV